MADEKKELEPIDTTGTTRMRPVPLKFGGVKAPEKKKSWLPRPGGKDHPGESNAEIPGLELESPRKIIRQGMLVVGLFFGILGVWAFFGTISGAVVAPGRIKIETERKIVQHLEGGIVDEILVREGEDVKEGQPLIVLESVRIDADATALEKELVALEAQRIRFEAEKDGKTSLSWPEELKQLAKNSANMDVLASEERIFASRQESQATQVSLLLAQIKQLNAQIGGYQDELKAEQKIISTLREELAAKRQLFKNRYVEKSQILGLERELAGHEGSAGKLRQSIAEARQRGAEYNLRINEIKIKFVEEATKSLGDIENQLTQNKERLRPLNDSRKRLQISAPVSGKVVDLQVHSPGGVVRGGETLMDIVPEDNPLIVDTQVPINRITEVYIGQPAQVQMDAFDTRTLPLVPARVTHISADSLQPKAGEGNMPYYLCYVEIDPDALKKNELYMAPGMPVTVYITTTEKSVIRYMFDPFIRSWNTALRD